MSATPHKRSPVDYSSQEIDNESWNDTYKIKEFAPYGYDSVSDAFLPFNVDIAYDYLSLAQTATVDTYTFKRSGSGGTTVKTLTITYTDSTKATISNMART